MSKIDVTDVLLGFPHLTETFVTEENPNLLSTGAKVHRLSLLPSRNSLGHPVSAEFSVEPSRPLEDHSQTWSRGKSCGDLVRSRFPVCRISGWDLGLIRDKLAVYGRRAPGRCRSARLDASLSFINPIGSRPMRSTGRKQALSESGREDRVLMLRPLRRLRS